IPASIAKNISRSISGYIILSALLGSIISAAGIFIAKTFSFLPGPAIILSGITLFLLSLLLKR
ncbi:MAG: metal ABC transporter permease, partial [Candidatus Portnoybacteria bacterium]|nr:metal ABC transporter permease [Candidatus Portnoybacteria bacterium]